MDLASDFEKSVEQKHADDLHENVAEDLVYVSRGNIAGNESQFLLSAFQFGTAWLYDMERYTNSVLTGPSAGGKTQLQDAVKECIPSQAVYGDGEITDFSDNAPLDDPDWDRSLLFIGSEYDKISKPIRELFKSMSGDDGGYSKKRNTEDQSAEGGYSPATISSSAMPYQFQYANEGGKGGLDHELSTRMLKNPIEDNKGLRGVIGRKEWGHEKIVTPNYDVEYIYPTFNREAALRAHMRKLPVYEKYDDGTEVWDVTLEDSPTLETKELVTRRGASFARLPRWAWYAVEPIFDMGSTHTNRVFGMLSNLVRASAVWNHHERDRIPKMVDETEREAILVEPQDLVNVLCTQETLLGTTHLLSKRKRDVMDAVRACNDVGEATVKNIRDWLSNNDKTTPAESTLRTYLDELAEEFFIDKIEGAGPNGAHLYEHLSLGAVKPPRMHQLQQVANSDGVDLSGNDCRIDLDDPFDGCVDPIRNQPFKETVSEFESTMSKSNDLGSRASGGSRKSVDNLSDAMHGDDSNSSTDGGGSDGQTSLEDVGDGNDDETTENNTLTYPTDIVTAEVYEYIRGANVDEHIYNLDGVGHDIEDIHFLGVLDTDVAVEDGDLSETIYDPSHSLWSHEAVSDDRATTWSEVRTEIESSIQQLREDGLIDFVEGGEQTDIPNGFVSVEVTDVEGEPTI